jgi:hypothetical protein
MARAQTEKGRSAIYVVGEAPECCFRGHGVIGFAGEQGADLVADMCRGVVLPGSQCAPPSVKYSQLAPASSPVTLIGLQDQWYQEELCRRRMPHSLT